MKRSYIKVLFTFVVAALFLLGSELVLEKTLLQSSRYEKVNIRNSAFELSSEHYGKAHNTATFEDFIQVLKDKKTKNGVVFVIDGNKHNYSFR